MLELLVILDEKDEKERESIYYKISEDEKYGHLSGLINFNNEHNLNIENIDKMSSYEASSEVAKRGFVNIHVTDGFMLIYLPKFITENQKKWFKNHMKALSKFILAVSSEQLDGSFKSLQREDETTTKLNDLKRELKRKELLEEIYNKEKTRKVV